MHLSMNTPAHDPEELQDVEGSAAEETDLDLADRSDADPRDLPKERIDLEVKVDNLSACERRIVAVVPRADIERYFEAQYDELTPKAEVPGFRAGKAPRKLVVARFKQTVAEQVKGKLLLDCLAQISDEFNFAAISEPDLNFEAVVLPDEGDMTFEYTVEVRPEFDLPEWKGLTLDQPQREIADQDVETQLQRLLARHGTFVDHDGPVEDGLYVTLNLTFSHDGDVVSRVQDRTIPVKPKLSFRDAQLDSFASLIQGAVKGDRRTATLTVSETVDNEQWKGQQIQVEIEIVKVLGLQLPKLTDSFLRDLGGFADEAELRGAVQEELERQETYRRQQAIRQQITSQLTAGANWALPPTLLRKQTEREMGRMVMELQAAGFSNDAIQAHANALTRRSLGYTETALKEHFILERIADDEKIDADEADYDREIDLIAEQSHQSPRRVRARLEKNGELDSLRNQIVERKVIELITSRALVREVPYTPPADDVAAIDHVVSGAERRKEIPAAQHGEEPKPRPGTPTSHA